MKDRKARKCKVEDCQEKHYAGGFCAEHRTRDYVIKNYGEWRVPIQRNVGRQPGHRLSQQTKDKMAQSKTGYRPSIESRNKTANSLKKYFKTNNSLSKELLKMYGDEISDWIEENKEAIDAMENVNTLSRLRSLRYTEYPASPVIETLAVEYDDPLILLLEKEELSEKTLEIYDE